ncbi:MAG: hypothetical protein WAZ18_05805 [Alphaproteobacteria bacterium]
MGLNFAPHTCLSKVRYYLGLSAKDMAEIVNVRTRDYHDVEQSRSTHEDTRLWNQLYQHVVSCNRLDLIRLFPPKCVPTCVNVDELPLLGLPQRELEAWRVVLNSQAAHTCLQQAMTLTAMIEALPDRKMREAALFLVAAEMRERGLIARIPEIANIDKSPTD